MVQPAQRKGTGRLPFPVLRMFLLASVAVVACLYAIVRYYTHPRRPMLVPIAEVDAGEIPAPDLESDF